MAKLYKIVYHFKDGVSWDEQTHDVALQAEHIPVLLNQLSKKDTMEIKQQSTGETRTSGELKSIELLF